MRNKTPMLILITALMSFNVTAAFALGPGLWAGDATLYGVSGVNNSPSNLVFDLALNGTRSDSSSTNMLIGRGASGWKYDNSGADLGKTWIKPVYNDSGWTSGQGPFSFSAGPTTAYFRKTFTVDSALKYSGMLLRLLRDDGAVVYLNGVEILRANMAPDNVTFDKFALSEADINEKSDYIESALPAALLLDGGNTIAVEVHRSGIDDQDLTFDLELLGVYVSPVAVIPPKSAWTFDDSGKGQATTDWRMGTPDFVGNWRTANGVFGYVSPDSGSVTGLDTVLNYGDPNNKYAAYYFIKHFNVADPTVFSELNMFLRRNDGAVVYINGTEVWRSNMPETGEIKYTTPPVMTVGPEESALYLEKDIPAADYLQTGDNVIAVEVHQSADELSDRSGTGGVTTTPAELSTHIIFHVSDAGDVRLLKEAIIMKDTKDGHTVILTDDSLISNYTGPKKREGTAIGIRLSSVSYDFDGQSLPCNNSIIDLSPAITCSFNIGRTHPTNPFLHRYNPEHDELDPFYAPIREGAASHEVNAISRIMTLKFQDRFPSDERQPAGALPPGWGASQTGGIFTEVLTGLIKDSITVKGNFSLQRISDRGKLNE